jgi:fatty-acyl-CoA synthase
VQSAAAIGQPDAAKGEMPIAYVQLKPGATTSAEELLALCREQVQERAAVPVQIQITAQIPLTAVGKINKPALRTDAMLRVARDQAAAIIGDTGTFDATVDESGVRPRVKLDIRPVLADVVALREQLEAAFGRYEFETMISVVDPHTGG